MTGLDKIISEIRAESSKTISERIDKANREAADIQAEAEKEAREACERISRETSARLSASKSAAESAALLRKKRLLLEEKQKLIGEVIEAAKKEVLALSDAEYFSLMETLIKEHAAAEEGHLFFNERDLKRLPADFETKINAMLSGKGGKLTVSKDARPIDGGFVLKYKGIDQNCSVTSIFETNLELLQDKIQALLF